MNDNGNNILILRKGNKSVFEIDSFQDEMMSIAKMLDGDIKKLDYFLMMWK